jgi:hypothetical protein
MDEIKKDASKGDQKDEKAASIKFVIKASNRSPKDAEGSTGKKRLVIANGEEALGTFIASKRVCLEGVQDYLSNNDSISLLVSLFNRQIESDQEYRVAIKNGEIQAITNGYIKKSKADTDQKDVGKTYLDEGQYLTQENKDEQPFLTALKDRINRYWDSIKNFVPAEIAASSVMDICVRCEKFDKTKKTYQFSDPIFIEFNARDSAELGHLKDDYLADIRATKRHDVAWDEIPTGTVRIGKYAKDSAEKTGGQVLAVSALASTVATSGVAAPSAAAAAPASAVAVNVATTSSVTSSTVNAAPAAASSSLTPTIPSPGTR